MNFKKKNHFKLKPHKIVLDQKYFSVMIEDLSEPIVFPSEILPIVNEFKLSNTIGSAWENLQNAGEVRLTDIHLAVQKLTKAGAFEHNDDLQKKASWLDFVVFKFNLCDQVQIGFKSITAFTVFSLIYLLIAGTSIFTNYWDLPLNNYLQYKTEYTFAIPQLFLMFTLLGFVKGLIKIVLITLATATLPKIELGFRGMMADLLVDESKILTQSSFYKRMYLVSDSFGFLFAGVLASSIWDSDFSRQLQITAILMTLTWANPFRKSELTQVLSSFFEKEEALYLNSYYRKKSLFGFLNFKKATSTETKMAVFSTIAMLWAFVFIGFNQEIISSNIGYWINEIEIGNWIEKVSVIFIFVAFGSLLLLQLTDLLKTIVYNFLQPFLTTVFKWSRRLRSESLENYSQEKIVACLRESIFFWETADSTLKKIASLVVVKKMKREIPIIVHGEVAAELFLVLDGEVRVEKENDFGHRQLLTVLPTGAVFGESALIENAKRTANVFTNTDAIVGTLRKKDLISIWDLADSPEFQAITKKVTFIRTIQAANLFKDLPLELLQVIVQKGRLVEYEANGVILNAGDQGDSFYIIASGEVEILQNGKKRAELKAGQYFGEIAILKKTVRTAEVRALTKVSVLRIERDYFRELLVASLDLTLLVESTARQRLEVNYVN